MVLLLAPLIRFGGEFGDCITNSNSMRILYILGEELGDKERMDAAFKATYFRESCG